MTTCSFQTPNTHSSTSASSRNTASTRHIPSDATSPSCFGAYWDSPLMTRKRFTSFFCEQFSLTTPLSVVATSSASVTPWISPLPLRSVLPSSVQLGLCVSTKTFLALRPALCYPIDTSTCLLHPTFICSIPWHSSATCPRWALLPARLVPWSRFFPTTHSRSSSWMSPATHTVCTRSEPINFVALHTKGHPLRTSLKVA